MAGLFERPEPVSLVVELYILLRNYIRKIDLEIVRLSDAK